jgi:hypothetical protein
MRPAGTARRPRIPARAAGRRLVSVGVLVALAAATLAAADVKVTTLVTDGQVYASFAVPSAYSSDARDVVRSGLPLSCVFTVELKRSTTLWFDRTIASATVMSSVKFDTLTGTYQVSKEEDDKVIWSDRTDEEDQMRAWLTAFDRVAIGARDPLEPNAEYYVQVRLHVTPRRTFSLWPPWGRDDGSGRADFTFIR